MDDCDESSKWKVKLRRKRKSKNLSDLVRGSINNVKIDIIIMQNSIV